MNATNDQSLLYQYAATFTLMSYADLGGNTVIKHDQAVRYIPTDRTDMGGNSMVKVCLDDEPMTGRIDLVDKGTICYRGRLPDSDQWSYVVKFKWRATGDPREEDIMRVMAEHHVRNVLTLDYVEEFASISTGKFRQGLFNGVYREVVTPSSTTDNVTDDAATEALKQVGIGHCTEATDDEFEDRTLICVITSPAGRSMNTFRSHLELLSVLQDTVIAHRSMFQSASVIHQDISPANIIIVDPQNGPDNMEEGKGYLIDYDVARPLSLGPLPDGRITGTRAYQAVDILELAARSYRHDLESLFYVFLWMAITDGGEPRKGSMIQEWDSLGRVELAEYKMETLRRGKFGGYLEEIASSNLKRLAEEWRGILFGMEADLFVGTREGAVNEDYDAVLEALQRAIEKEKKHNTTTV